MANQSKGMVIRFDEARNEIIAKAQKPRRRKAGRSRIPTRFQRSARCADAKSGRDIVRRCPRRVAAAQRVSRCPRGSNECSARYYAGGAAAARQPYLAAQAHGGGWRKSGVAQILDDIRAQKPYSVSAMITELEIQNFRGFKNLKLEGLRRVNLLVGGNDTGKTSILEAIVLLLGDRSALQHLAVGFRNNQADGQPTHNQDDIENYWMWLFREKDLAKRIQLACNTEKGISILLQSVGTLDSPAQRLYFQRKVGSGGLENLVQIQNGSFQWLGTGFAAGIKISRLSVRPTHPVEDAERYNLVALNPEGEQKIESVMRVIEPRLRRLRYAKLPGTSSPLVFADIGLSKAVPSTQMGQGFNRVLHMYCEILSQRANVLLVDEIENGIFSEFLPTVWQGLLAICEVEEVQIFATTHSRECVMAAFASAGERAKDELGVYRLQRVKGEIEAVRLEAKHLELAAEMGLEVRS